MPDIEAAIRGEAHAAEMMTKYSPFSAQPWHQAYASILGNREEGARAPMNLPACRTYVAGLAACLFAAAPEPASSADASYCITCKNPDQTYLCRVTAGGARPSDALKLYCVMRTAKEGNHASCSAVRSPSCNGIEKVYSYDGPMPEDIASDVRKARERIQQEQKAFEKPNSDGPDTLVELTGRARERLRNARGALRGRSEPDQPLPADPLPKNETATPLSADASPTADTAERPGLARRSYRCVMSLFRNCRSETAGQGQ